MVIVNVTGYTSGLRSVAEIGFQHGIARNWTIALLARNRKAPFSVTRASLVGASGAVS